MLKLETFSLDQSCMYTNNKQAHKQTKIVRLQSLETCFHPTDEGAHSYPSRRQQVPEATCYEASARDSHAHSRKRNTSKLITIKLELQALEDFLQLFERLQGGESEAREGMRQRARAT